MAIPAYVNFEGFHHAVAVNIGGSRAQCQAEFVVAAKGWTLCQVNFESDVRRDVHAGIAGVCCDMDVGFFALENGSVWNLRPIEVEAQGIFLMQIVDAESQATAEVLAIATVRHTKREALSLVEVLRSKTQCSPGLICTGR